MKPITINSLKFTDERGNLIVQEDYYSLIVVDADHANAFIDSRKTYFEGMFLRKLTVSPDMNETLKLVEIKKVFRYTARKLQIPLEKILSKTRKREYVDARRFAIKICRMRGISHALIAEQIGWDRTTIIHHDKTLTDLMETNDQIFKEYYEVEDYVLTTLNGSFKEDGSGDKIENNEQSGPKGVSKSG